MMGRCPFGGQTWLYLNWLRGFHRLGHEVWYVEDDATWPYDPVADTITEDPRYATGYLHRTLSAIGLGDRWAYRPLYRGGDECFGLPAGGLRDLYRGCDRGCDAPINLCGATVLNEEHALAARRVYIQTDPGTNGLEVATGTVKTRVALASHDTILTYGALDCGVPRPPEITYLETRQPVDLALWPVAFDPGAPPSATGSGPARTWSGAARPTPGASTTSSSISPGGSRSAPSRTPWRRSTLFARTTQRKAGPHGPSPRSTSERRRCWPSSSGMLGGDSHGR